MYKPDEKDYYLRRDFNGEYDNYGTPYLDEKCTLSADGQSSNLIIYGHNMKTGTVFGSLTGYKEASYYDEHPLIQFDTLYGDGSYEVFAAFPSTSTPPAPSFHTTNPTTSTWTSSTSMILSARSSPAARWTPASRRCTATSC